MSAESLCDREDIITANIRSVKLSSPDVSGTQDFTSQAHVSTLDGMRTRLSRTTGRE